jgi:hypothetical protein
MTQEEIDKDVLTLTHQLLDYLDLQSHPMKNSEVVKVIIAAAYGTLACVTCMKKGDLDALAMTIQSELMGIALTLKNNEDTVLALRHSIKE